MNDPKLVLAKANYTNYRNVRAVAIMFVVVGMLCLLVGVISIFSDGKSQNGNEISPLVAVLCMILGLSGVVGGIAVRSQNRKWSKVVYVMAILYLLVFPIGTILSAVMLTGLGKYFKSIDQLGDEKSLGFSPVMPPPNTPA